MRRRDFIKLVVGAGGAWPLSVKAQRGSAFSIRDNRPSSALGLLPFGRASLRQLPKMQPMPRSLRDLPTNRSIDFRHWQWS
jgi:hypothetical protein